jgi:hypothetical protein
MSTNEPPKNSQEETKVLNLGKFAPNQPAASPSEPGEEGQTLFFLRAASEAAQPGGPGVVAPKAGNAIPAKELLGAVAYCYAKGVYSSSEIEGRMLRDPKLRAATHDEIPNAQAIRRFRRTNRAAIQQTLEKWYRRLRKSKPTTAVMPGAQPPEPSPLPPGPAVAPSSENTSIFVKREASDRLDKAAFIDNMETD